MQKNQLLQFLTNFRIIIGDTFRAVLSSKLLTNFKRTLSIKEKITKTQESCLGFYLK